MKYALVLLPLFVLAACHTSPSPPPPGPTREEHTASIKAYEDKNGKYRCTPEECPDFAEFKTSGVFLNEQALGRGLRLVLKLGEQTEAMIGNERYYRTESRYQLMQGKKVLCEAESTLSKGMKPIGTRCRIMFHEHSLNVVIEEEHDWSTSRQIVMCPKGNGSSPAWEAKVVGVPTRAGGPGTTNGEGTIIGGANGKVYTRVDGFIYAFPLEKLDEVKNLGFLPG
jgi:hypothetical protein